MRIIESAYDLEKFIKEKEVRYFKADEFACKCGCGRVLIADRLILLLDALRDYLQKPIIITSAYRCPSYNRKVGGVPTSAHVYGLAVDIACTSSKDRYDIVKFLLGNGAERIGIGKDFIHFDFDEEKPKPRIWHYYYTRR